MNTEGLQKEILESFEIDAQLMPVNKSNEEQFVALRKLLMQRIEELAGQNMEKLMWLLYRIDVSEKKLHEILKQTAPGDFSAVIADMIIERQVQKINTRHEFGEKENDWNFDV